MFARLSAGLALIVLTVASARADSIYTLTDLGPNAHSLHLNDSGVVAGLRGELNQYGGGETGPQTGFVYQNGQSQNLAPGVRPVHVTPAGDVLDGTKPFSFYYNGILSRNVYSPGWAVAGNDQGQMVGTASGTPYRNLNDYSVSKVGYVYGPVPPGGSPNYDSVTGRARNDYTAARNDVGRETYLNAINNAGTVAGGLLKGPGDRLPDGSLAKEWMTSALRGTTNLGNLPGDNWTVVYAINNKGEIAGISRGQPNGQRAFVGGADGKLLPIEVPKQLYAALSVGAINERGQVVGSAGYPTWAPSEHAFLYDPAKQAAEDLNNLIPNTGWVLNAATDINESGQIVGTMTGQDGTSHGFLLTPVAAPEPSTLVLFATVGLGTWAWRQARQKRV
jgi:probable HAF family extracellular repeat protein